MLVHSLLRVWNVTPTSDSQLKFLAAIKDTFAKFALLMHVGTTDNNGKLTQSKTEAMYFPAWL